MTHRELLAGIEGADSEHIGNIYDKVLARMADFAAEAAQLHGREDVDGILEYILALDKATYDVVTIAREIEVNEQPKRPKDKPGVWSLVK